MYSMLIVFALYLLFYYEDTRRAPLISLITCIASRRLGASVTQKSSTIHRGTGPWEAGVWSSPVFSLRLATSCRWHSQLNWYLEDPRKLFASTSPKFGVFHDVGRKPQSKEETHANTKGTQKDPWSQDFQKDQCVTRMVLRLCQSKGFESKDWLKSRDGQTGDFSSRGSTVLKFEPSSTQTFFVLAELCENSSTVVLIFSGNWTLKCNSLRCWTQTSSRRKESTADSPGSHLSFRATELQNGFLPIVKLDPPTLLFKVSWRLGCVYSQIYLAVLW